MRAKNIQVLKPENKDTRDGDVVLLISRHTHTHPPGGRVHFKKRCALALVGFWLGVYSMQIRCLRYSKLVGRYAVGYLVS